MHQRCTEDHSGATGKASRDLVLYNPIQYSGAKARLLVHGAGLLLQTVRGVACMAVTPISWHRGWATRGNNGVCWEKEAVHPSAVARVI